MALYKVTDRDDPEKPRLVKATSGPAALKHVASEQYTVETMDNPTAVAELMESGVKLETAGIEPASEPALDPAPIPNPDPEPLAQTGGGSPEGKAVKSA